MSADYVAPRPYYDEGGITIYHGDCLDIMPALTFDFVVTDPPYGTGGRQRKEAGQGRGLARSIVREEWDHGDGLLWLKTLDPAIPVLTFWPGQRAWDLGAVAKELGRDRLQLLLWRKPDPMPVPKRFVQLTVEPVWCLFTGKLPLGGGPDLFTHTAIRVGRDRAALGHPYQKPLKLMEWLVGLARGETILDPFMGSGTTLRAAKDLGKRAIGIETDESYCEMAAKRFSQDLLDFGAAS